LLKISLITNVAGLHWAFSKKWTHRTAKLYEATGGVPLWENGLDAWNIFNSEQVDVILTDIQMSGLTGEELSRKIRNQSPHTKIAVMSGGGSDVAAGLLNEGTADYFFWKPFEIKKICKILKADAQAAT
jgi:DNA-binding NtrC family response regulator